MRKELVLGVIFASMVSANSFAMEIYKGKVVEHKEWSTGNAKIVFKPVAITASQYRDNFKKLTNAKSTRQLMAFAVAINAEAKVGEPAKIPGLHQVFIYNKSKETQNYRYRMSACLSIDGASSMCSYSEETVSLSPDGYVFDMQEPTVQVAFNEPGLYATNTMTEIFFADEESSMTSVASGAIKVS